MHALGRCIYTQTRSMAHGQGGAGPIAVVTLGEKKFGSKAEAKRAVRKILTEAQLGQPLTDESQREIAKACALLSGDGLLVAEGGWARGGGKVISVLPHPHSRDRNFVFRLNNDEWYRIGAMRAIDEYKIPDWNTQTHSLYPEPFKLKAQAFLLAHPPLHQDLVLKIIALAAGAP